MNRRVGIVIALAARPYRRAEKSLGIAGVTSADVLTRVTARLYWLGFLDGRQAKVAFRGARLLRTHGIKLALRPTNELSED